MSVSYLSQNIGSIAESDFANLNEYDTVDDAVKIMRDKDISSILITNKDSKEPIGIVTERDLLHRVMAENKDPAKTTLKSIMSSPLISSDEESPIKEGICLMRNKHIRRLPVKKRGKITGIVTLKTIVGNIPSQGIDLAEVESPKGSRNEIIICPYCQQRFDGKDKIVRHIDDAHLLNC